MIISLMIAIVAMLYFLYMYVYHYTMYIYIWPLLALIFFAVYSINKMYRNHPKRIPLYVMVSANVTMILGILVFVITSFFILTQSFEKEENHLDYIIVLSDANEKLLSKDFIYKMDTAKIYWQEHESVILVVSGGEVEEFGITKAQVMEEYLLANGIPRENIYLEMQSRNMREGIIYSKAIISNLNKTFRIDTRSTDIGIEVLQAEEKPKRIALLANRLSMYRAYALARKIGFSQLFTMAATQDIYNFANQLLVEVILTLKDKFMGYI